MVDLEGKTSNTLLETLEQWEAHLKAENIPLAILAQTSFEPQSEPQSGPQIQPQRPQNNLGGPPL